ncbi:MAG: ABC-2 transporter permease [Oscillospiraceae bacterium]|nr:ABC-2 transporter permease [Oscillospiraceae bacterium]
MKGLLLKDIFTITRQLKFYIIIVLVFACMPGYSMLTFALVYSAMLPMTALAYDERSGWDKLAAMMPYSAGEIVASKYIIGCIMLVGATLFSIIAQYVISLLGIAERPEDALSQIVAAICCAAVFQAVVIPLMVRFGVERGRVIFIALGAAIGFAVMYFAKAIENYSLPENASGTVFAVAAIFGVIVLNAASILISKHFYRNKRT